MIRRPPRSTLSLHDALPISLRRSEERQHEKPPNGATSASSPLGGVRSMRILSPGEDHTRLSRDRKSTRLNSSHTVISYAVFCLKKKKKQNISYIVPSTTTT